MLNQNKKSQIVNNEGGFSHLLLPAVVVVVALVGIGGAVYSASQHKNKPAAQSVTLTTSKSQGILATSGKPKSSSGSSGSVSSSSSTPSSSSSSKPASSSAKPSSQPSSTSSSSSSSSGSSSSSSGSPSQTPLSALTTIISNLYSGQAEAQVTTSNVTIPGPISNATGRPIVFSVNGQTYFAYSQEQKPNFNTTPSQTAQSMAIVSASGSYSTTSAYLDKAANLVDPDQKAVGYSTGGD